MPFHRHARNILKKKAKRKHWVKKQAKRASKYIGSKKSNQESNEMLACWMRN